MRIRFYNTYEPVSTLYRDLIPSLASQGIEVEIVVSAAEYRRGRNLGAFLQDQRDVRLTEIPSWGLRVDQGALAKAIITITYLIGACLVGFFGRSVDKNVFLTQPPLIALLGYVLKYIRRQPYVCIVMDLYPQIAVAMGLLKQEQFYYDWFRHIALNALQQAAQIIVIGRCMRQQLIEDGIEPSQITYIPNWADADVIVPVVHNENQLRHDMGWDDKFVVLYAGNIGIPQYFNDLLQVAKDLRSNTEIVFAFIGTGAREQEIVHNIRKHDLTNVVLHPFLHEQYSLATILSAADLHFVTLRDGIEGLAVPSKSYGILAAGRPILYQGKHNGEIAYMVSEEGIGYVVEQGMPGELSEAILHSFHNPQTRSDQQTKARQLAVNLYGQKQALQRYTTVLYKSMPHPQQIQSSTT